MSVASWFQGTSSVGHNSHSPPRRSSSNHNHHSPARSEQPKGYFVRSHSPSRSTYIASSTRAGGHHSSSSYYKRRPRDGYISRLVHKIKELLRRLYSYLKRNPTKLFMMVVVPLITGGALTKMMAKLGLRLPKSLSALGGTASAFGGGRGNDHAGGGIGVADVMNIAKMFM